MSALSMALFLASWRGGNAMSWLAAVSLRLAVLLLPAVPREAAGQSSPVGRTRVVMLGTGTPNADPDRSGPAVAVVVYGRTYLVDAGPGVVRRAASAVRAGEKALTVELAALAREARAKSLLLYHQLYWGATDAELLREIREAGYRGPVASALDLGVY